jgi:hypothetical protein
MQNKPNSLGAQTNVTSVITMNYEQITMNDPNKNKPNQTQFRSPAETLSPVGCDISHRPRLRVSSQVIPCGSLGSFGDFSHFRSIDLRKYRHFAINSGKFIVFEMLKYGRNAAAFR